jgi:peptidoglycan hydrolase-like protein with peptidoglycan-binding domain
VLRRQRGGSGRKRVALIGAAAVAVAGAGAGVVLLTSSHSPAGLTTRAAGEAGQAQTAVPMRVMAASPASGAQGVSGAAPIRLTLAAPDPGAQLPRISPAVPGSWQRAGDTLTFTPAVGFGPHTRVTVSVVQATGSWTDSFTTGGYSMLRLQQLLATLGYLPLSWAADLGGMVTPDNTAAQVAAAYTPPLGMFTWDRGYPASLSRFWHPGQGNLITTGAIMAFESQHNMTMNGTVSPALWAAVLRATGQQQLNRSGYTYAIASKALPETLTIWHDGHRVFSSPANTGIGVAPTASGTYPVYLRYYFQVMQGTNPDGSHYADPVYYVSYFDGGEAVHYFPRGSYGWPQSLGCVELPYSAAQKAWPYLTYGSLVTVTPA